MSITLGPIFNQQRSNVRSWEATIYLFDRKHKSIAITSVDMDVPAGATAEYRTTNGLVGMTMTESAPTIISCGKNLGKKNETTVLSQAYAECSSKYRIKIKAGYSETLSDATSDGPSSATRYPYPMALKPYKDFGSRLKYPLYMQPKLDGLRMIAMLNEEGQVVLKTRRLHDIAKFDRLKAQLQTLYDRSIDKKLILDGELYSHGMDLQTISGIVRSESGPDEDKDRLQYWLFDCFSTEDGAVTYATADPAYATDDPFETRLLRLKDFLRKLPRNSLLMLNDTTKVFSEEASDEYYQKVVGEGYEGAIYKSMGKPYEYSFDKEKRSSWYLKRKQQFDAEFEIVAYGQGKGKDLGCVVFVLRTPSGIEFNSVPNGTYEYRKDLYNQCQQDFSQFKGKMAKVTFEDYSNDGVPLRNRMIMIRDLSFD